MAERSRLINKSFYFAFFSKTTFLYQLSMTTNELLNTVHSILDSPSARLCHSREVTSLPSLFYHLIRHTNTLRLNSISVRCKHCVRHFNHKQRFLFLLEQKGEEYMYQRPFDLSNYPKVNTMFDTSTHVLHFLYCPDTPNSLQQ